MRATMGWRDRITDGLADVGAQVKVEISGRVPGLGSGATSVEGFILDLVRSARADDDDDAPTSAKELRKDAKRRRRRLGIAAFAAGPLAGVAGEASDLYSETAVVCDLVELHGLELTDAQIGGHMLSLWGLAADPALGAAALDGTGPSIAELLRAEAAAAYQAADSVPKKVKVIWKHRNAFSDVREAVTTGAFSRVLRAGRDSKDLIARAEASLGVAR